MAGQVLFEHDKDFYHQLLDMYLASAKNNPHSFLEFRIQSNILRTKFTTTARPNNNGLERNKTSFHNIPPTVNNGPHFYRQQPPPPKRCHASIISPPLQRPSPSMTHQKQKQPNGQAHPSGSNSSPAPTQKSPEIVRDTTSSEYDHSDHESVVEEVICSDFTSPNRFNCLAQLDQAENDADQLTNTDNAIVSSPLSTPTLNSNTTCIDNHGSILRTPSLELTPQKTPNANYNIRFLCEDCKKEREDVDCKCADNEKFDTTTTCVRCNLCLCERIHDVKERNERCKKYKDYVERPLPTH